MTNLYDKIANADEAFTVTTTAKNVGAIARSVFKIQKVDSSHDSIVRYGDDIRLATNDTIYDKPLYLHS